MRHKTNIEWHRKRKQEVREGLLTGNVEMTRKFKQVMIHSARARAKKRGVPCTITPNDFNIPPMCPALGIPLEPSSTGVPSDNSPSLDCINPYLGYVPGNVVVISKRANTIKGNANWREIKSVYEFTKFITEQTAELRYEQAGIHLPPL